MALWKEHLFYTLNMTLNTGLVFSYPISIFPYFKYLHFITPSLASPYFVLNILLTHPRQYWHAVRVRVGLPNPMLTHFCLVSPYFGPRAAQFTPCKRGNRDFFQDYQCANQNGTQIPVKLNQNTQDVRRFSLQECQLKCGDVNTTKYHRTKVIKQQENFGRHSVYDTG